MRHRGRHSSGQVAQTLKLILRSAELKDSMSCTVKWLQTQC
jgi:hypothetical protein